MRRPPRVVADELADQRVVDAGQLDAHHLLDRGLRVGDAGQVAERHERRVGCPLHRREDLGEVAFGVVALARAVQRVHRRQRGDEAAGAAGDDERDRQRLAPELAQVAQQLAVEGFHRAGGDR
ncbi:MAG: hypothetical protein U1F67_03090 [Rubrivivax sp.]